MTTKEVGMADVPLYDPAEHSDPGQVVRVEMWCACGGALRQLDPVSHVRPQVDDFVERHSGSGHAAVSPGDALTEREERRAAAFRAKGEQDDYAPKEHPDLDPDGEWSDWTRAGA